MTREFCLLYSAPPVLRFSNLHGRRSADYTSSVLRQNSIRVLARKSNRYPGPGLLGICLAALIVGMPASGEIVYGLFANSSILAFDPAAPSTIISNVPLFTPPPATAQGLIAIALRPDNGQLYGVNGTGVYILNPATGTQAFVAPSPLSASDYTWTATFQPGTGNLFVLGFVSRDLLEINVDTQVITNLGQLTFAAADINAGKASNEEAVAWGTAPGASAPSLYGIDANFGLVKIDASTAAVTTVGPIPAFADANSGAGFTISGLTGTAYLVLPIEEGSGSPQVLFTVNLQTGGSELVGAIDDLPDAPFSIAAADVTTIPVVESPSPSCTISSIVAGPPKELNVLVQAVAGLSSIEVTQSSNVTINVPLFFPSTTSPVTVTATKIDQSQTSTFTLLVNNLTGQNPATCDPVDFTVQLEGAEETHVFRSVTNTEHYIRVVNGNPGPRRMTFLVNEKSFEVTALGSGEVRVLDISSAMTASSPVRRPGRFGNTIKLVVQGARGESASILIGDSSVAGP
jgi:hypothetical protein